MTARTARSDIGGVRRHDERMMMRAGWMVALAAAWGCGPVVGDDEAGQSASDTSTTGTSQTATGPTTTMSNEVGPLETGEVEVATGNPTIDPAFDFGGVDDTTEGCPYWASSQCALLGESNAFGSAMTPLGEIPIVYAYFAAQTACGGCVDPNVAYVYLL
jgi:hypothetical protein